MMYYSLTPQQLAAIVGGTVIQNADVLIHIGRKNVQQRWGVAGVSTDTRYLEKGDLFFALTGQNFDGHQFVAQAFASGACACIVAQKVNCSKQGAIIAVKDTQKALASLAAYHRTRLGQQAQIAAVAGSCGKTTVKQMLASILMQSAQTTYSYGNFNNEIGCPLSVLTLRPDDRYAVFEIGSSAQGEIERLSQIVQPHLAIITNIYLEHTLTFGSLQDIAQGESEVLLHLSAGSCAVLPQEDAMLPYLKSRMAPGCQLSTFGFSSDADVYVESISNTDFILVDKKRARRINCQIPVLGRHNILNACAAACAALVWDIAPECIEQGLKKFQPEQMRFEITHSAKQVVLINDCYNSNPGSLRASLHSFSESFTDYKKYVVLADMLELGDLSKTEHQALAPLLAGLKIEKIFLSGAHMQHTWQALAQNFPNQKVVYQLDAAAFLPELKNLAGNDSAILFKASRGLRLEKIIKEL